MIEKIVLLGAILAPTGLSASQSSWTDKWSAGFSDLGTCSLTRIYHDYDREYLKGVVVGFVEVADIKDLDTTELSARWATVLTDVKSDQLLLWISFPGPNDFGKVREPIVNELRINGHSAEKLNIPFREDHESGDDWNDYVIRGESSEEILQMFEKGIEIGFDIILTNGDQDRLIYDEDIYESFYIRRAQFTGCLEELSPKTE